MKSPAVLFQQVLAGIITADGLAWLQAAFEQHDRYNGALSLERCLRIPSTSQRNREYRDHWLREAAAYLSTEEPAARKHELATALHDFVSGHAWRVSRDLAAPPLQFTQLDRALWHVAKSMKGRRGGTCLSAKQVARILDKESG